MDFHNKLISKNKLEQEDSNKCIKVKSFINNYLENCIYEIDDRKFKSASQKCIINLLKSKLLILNKIKEIFVNAIYKFEIYIKENQNKFLSECKKIKRNLKDLKSFLNDGFKKDHEFSNIHQQWKNEIKVKIGDKKYNSIQEKFSINNLKKILTDIVKDKINLEMNYTFDSKFCL